MIIVHEGTSPFVCEVLNHDGTNCGAGFDSEAKLKSHAGRVHRARTFLCTMCSLQEAEVKEEHDYREDGSMFATHAALQAHIASEHPPTCADCGLKCTSQSALKSHVEVIHGGLGIDERRIHFCPEADCGRAFTKKGNLNAHIQISHVGKRFVCGVVDVRTLKNVEDWDGSDACGEASTTKRNLERHIRTVHLGLGPIGKTRKKEKRGPLEQPALKNQVSAFTRLTGSGYEDESGRNIACLIQGCDHRFYRDYDLEIHLQSRHGLADLEIQEMLMGGNVYGRPSFQGPPVFATKEDVEAEKAFDMQFSSDVAMKDADESLEGVALRGGDSWLGGQSYQTSSRSGEDLRSELGMQQMVNRSHEWANDGGGASHDVDMIDPSLR